MGVLANTGISVQKKRRSARRDQFEAFQPSSTLYKQKGQVIAIYSSFLLAANPGAESILWEGHRKTITHLHGGRFRYAVQKTLFLSHYKVRGTIYPFIGTDP